MSLKTGTQMELILLTKISLKSRRDFTRNSEQTVLANQLANQLTNTENEFSMTWRSQSTNLAELHSQSNPFGNELHQTHRYDGKMGNSGEISNSRKGKHNDR